MEGDLPGLRNLSPRWLDRLAELWPSRTAIVDPDRAVSYSYGDLCRRAAATAATLASHGAGPGDRVVTIMDNGVSLLDLLFACGRLGAILVPVNWRLSPPEIAHVVEDTQPRCLVVDSHFSQLAPQATQSVPILSSTELLESVEAPPDRDMRMSDPWLILYTGGTTGAPKGAILTHGSITWNSLNTIVSWGLSERDVAPSFAPMFHTGGFNVFTLPLLMLGGTVILPRRFDPAQAIEILTRERPTVLFMVPTMFALLADQDSFRDADLSSLRWCISGGAPLPDVVYERWRGKVRVFKQGYGLTEVGPNNFATPDEDARRKQGTVGRLTYFAQARIVDENRRDVPAGESGELLLAGPHMCAGYWRRPEATADAIRDGWFHTGDIARRDHEGYYYIVDRKKDMIITGGENVYPAEVEEVLYAHPAIREVAVVGIPDATWGEAICAVIAPTPGAPLQTEELLEFMNGRLARYKIPKSFHIVDELPKSAAGKIVRREARKLATRRPL